VPLLAILDAGPGLPHEAAAGRPADAGAAATLPRFDAADLLAAAFQSVLPVTAAEVRALPEDERLPHLLARAGAAGKLPPGIDLAHAQRLLVTFQAHQAAARGYRPGPYPGRLTLIRATAGTGPLRHDPTLGWGSLAAAVEIHEVPARHEDIVAPPHVAGLASCLRRCLAATTSDCPPLR
jgi:thioesterase domain-containing protein